MSLQLAKLILYNQDGEVRELLFRTGALNILTGASKTGKSAIIDIVDYCTGRGECKSLTASFENTWAGTLCCFS